MSDYTLSYTGEEVNGLLNTVNSNHAAWDSISRASDYVVGIGTSGIWSWRKWASGIAELFGSTTFESGAWASWGSMYYSLNDCGNIPYPFEFIGYPIEQVTLGQATFDLWLIQSTACSKTSTGSYYGGRAASATNTDVDVYVDFYVVGQWK